MFFGLSPPKSVSPFFLSRHGLPVRWTSGFAKLTHSSRGELLGLWWLVGGLELLFSIIWHNASHWRTPSFFKMVGQPPTRSLKISWNNYSQMVFLANINQRFRFRSAWRIGPRVMWVPGYGSLSENRMPKKLLIIQWPWLRNRKNWRYLPYIRPI